MDFFEELFMAISIFTVESFFWQQSEIGAEELFFSYFRLMSDLWFEPRLYIK